MWHGFGPKNTWHGFGLKLPWTLQAMSRNQPSTSIILGLDGQPDQPVVLPKNVYSNAMDFVI
jgi:hypothetical protein